MTGYLRRRLSTAIVKANVKCLLEQLVLVGEGRGQTDQRRQWAKGFDGSARPTGRPGFQAGPWLGEEISSPCELSHYYLMIQRQRLSVLLTRDNVAMLGSRAPTLPPATIDGDIEGGEDV